MVKNIFWVTLFVLTPLLKIVAADEHDRTALQVIQSEGELAFDDGSSFYRFKKDGTFESGPCGISGRTMTGKWRAPGGDASKTVEFFIDAQVGWINGMQAPNDFRTISMWVYPGFALQDKDRDAKAPHVPQTHFYHCYFLIEEMRKKT